MPRVTKPIKPEPRCPPHDWYTYKTNDGKVHTICRKCSRTDLDG